jgi:hypothetical protein
MAEEKETREKELEELRSAAKIVVDMVDPSEEGVVSDKTLLEPLKRLPITSRRPRRHMWRISWDS